MNVRRPDLVPAIVAMCETTSARHGRVRVGLDVVSVSWMARRLAAGEDSAFIRGVFTSAEREYSRGRPERFAARWAAKEAVAKAIGTGFRGLRPGDIEVLHHQDGRAEIAVAQGSSWPDETARWDWALTLCHEQDAAVAVAVATEPNRA